MGDASRYKLPFDVSPKHQTEVSPPKSRSRTTVLYARPSLIIYLSPSGQEPEGILLPLLREFDKRRARLAQILSPD